MINIWGEWFRILKKKSFWLSHLNGSGSTRPEVKSALDQLVLSKLGPVYFQSVVHVNNIRFGFCIISWTKSKKKKILTNIAIKLFIDRIEGDLATWLKVMAVLNLMKVLTLCQTLTDRFISCEQGNYRFLNIWISKNFFETIIYYSLCFTSSFPYMPLWRKSFLTCTYSVLICTTVTFRATHVQYSSTIPAFFRGMN